jgi:putative ABC transport system permease protein
VLSTVLARLSSTDLAQSILGDLEEERARRAVLSSKRRATLWFLRASVAVLVYVLARRLRDAFTRRAGVPPRVFAARAGRWRRELQPALRSLRRAPWYSLTVVGVIALSMTLATTVFAIVDGVLFKPLPYLKPGELCGIEGWFSWSASRGTSSLNPISRRDIEAWSAAVPEMTIAASVLGTSSPLPDGDTVRSAQIDRAFLDVLGVRPLLGGFLPEHFEANAKIEPALISYRLWQSRFGGQPSVLGTIVRHHRAPDTGIEIVGVLPREFVMPGASRVEPEVLLPLGSRRALSGRELRGIARLPAPLTAAAVRPRLDAAARAAMAGFVPRPPWPGISDLARRRLGPYDEVRLVPFNEYLTDEQRPLFGLVLALAATLIGLAAINVAGLTAARTQDRARELSVRRALGASRLAVARVLLVESALLVCAGTALGAALAGPLLAAALRVLPDNLTLLKPAEIDGRVLAFAALAAVASTLAVALWPILTMDRFTRVTSDSTSGARVAVQARGWGGRVVVAAQVGLAVTLAIGGALFVGSLARVWGEDPGFSTHDSATFRVSFGPAGSADRAVALADEIRNVPGVRAVAAFSTPFLQRAWIGTPFARPAGRDDPPGLGADAVRIGPGFFEAARVRLLAGRYPTDDELRHAAPVVMVSQAVASAYWPDQPAVGQTLIREGQPPRPYTVIGVVADARLKALDARPAGEIYESVRLLTSVTSMMYFVSFTSDPSSGLSDVLGAISRRHPEYAASRSQLVDDALAESIRRRRFQTLLFASFGVSALVIVGVGILGLMAMRSARRTRELGIRIAIGATRESVIALLVREQVSSVIAGLAAGAVVSFWAVRAVRQHIYGDQVYDLTTWSAAVALLLVVAATGAFIPAYRASRVDPVSALRNN